MPITLKQLQEMRPSPEEEKKQWAELLQKMKEYHERGFKLYLPSKDISSEAKSAITALEQANPTDFQAIAASQLELANSYYTSVRNQSDQSFLWARITSGIGLAFFLVAAAFLIIDLGNISYFSAAISALGGVVVEVYAGLIQSQGKQKAEQASEYHIRLDRIQRFIITNSACEGLDGPEKQQKRSEIISKLVE